MKCLRRLWSDGKSRTKNTFFSCLKNCIFSHSTSHCKIRYLFHWKICEKHKRMIYSLVFFHRRHSIYGFGLSMAMTFRLSFKHWVKQHLSTDSQLSDLVFGLFSRFCIIFSPNPHPPPSFARSPGPSEKTDGCCQKAAATAGGLSKIVQGEQKSIPDFLEIFPGSQMFSDGFF